MRERGAVMRGRGRGAVKFLSCLVLMRLLDHFFTLCIYQQILCSKGKCNTSTVHSDENASISLHHSYFCLFFFIFFSDIKEDKPTDGEVDGESGDRCRDDPLSSPGSPVPVPGSRSRSQSDSQGESGRYTDLLHRPGLGVTHMVSPGDLGEDTTRRADSSQQTETPRTTSSSQQTDSSRSERSQQTQTSQTTTTPLTDEQMTSLVDMGFDTVAIEHAVRKVSLRGVSNREHQVVMLVSWLIEHAHEIDADESPEPSSSQPPPSSQPTASSQPSSSETSAAQTAASGAESTDAGWLPGLQSDGADLFEAMGGEGVRQRECDLMFLLCALLACSKT